jgi:hypothetical protein
MDLSILIFIRRNVLPAVLLPSFSLLHEIELDNALRRSLVQEALTEQLTRSRIEAAIQLEKVRQEATFTAEFALRRSRVEAEIEASRTITEAALHRSRVAADIQVTW